MSESPRQTDIGIVDGILLEKICRIERNGIFLQALSEQPLHLVPLEGRTVFYPQQSSEQVQLAFKSVVEKKVLTDKNFDVMARKLELIIKGRLDSWTPEESSHEALLFEEANGTRENS